MRCALCNLCFWLGDLWSKAVVRWWPCEWGASTVLRPYNFLMLKSVHLDEKYGCNVWTDTPDP